ncbi:hypothetical protein P0D88_40915 [Paraburkholderia sp. RL18-103-BIB-C]|uniref:hypothetical protein n=1 Tax=unclassified Paraburkholderia TaxID=2615204 RepID=UPI0038B9E60D
MKNLIVAILLAGPAFAIAANGEVANQRQSASQSADSEMQKQFGTLNTGRVRNLSHGAAQKSPDAAVQREFGSLNTGRVRNLTTSH